MIPGYRILRELGRGGMATVYLALQESLNREVALKLLAPMLAQDQSFSERFLREARIAGSFSHRHLIAVLDAGRSDEGLYLAMEYIRGGNAASLRGGDPAEIVRCVREMALALDYAHARGVVHRDLKPENILRRDDGSYVLSDFGIARCDDGEQPLTGPNAVLGTPAYMSPEQWKGETLDGRSDLYSLGIVFFDLLSGKVPYSGTDGWAIGMQHMSAERPKLPPQHARWQPVLDRLLAIRPDDRYANGAQVATALATDTPVLLQTAQTPKPFRPQTMAAPKAIARPARNSLRPMVVGILLLSAALLAWLGWQRYSEAPPQIAAPDTSEAAQHAATPAASTAVADNKSIAVLAFENMSADKDNEYFSDGIAEEILNSLAKIRSLKVAGRTSSFSFKGKDEDLRSIGKALGVAHILEGSVRKQGDKVRVTAQLIRSEDGIHLWSETYDGDVNDVFALQEKIARAITNELDLVLNGQQATRLVNAGTTNAEAYALYLQATSIFNRRDGDHFLEAVAALEESIRLDPTYARAHSRLAALYAVLPSYTDANVGKVHAEVLRYAKAASALDPTLAEPYAALGLNYGTFSGMLLAQFEAMERAQALDPDDVTTNFWYGLTLIKAGYSARGIQLLDRALALDPMLPNALRWRGSMYIHAGDLIRAEQVTRRARDLGMQTADGNLSKLAGARGDREEAVRLWVSGTKATMRGFSDEDRKRIAEGIYGDAAAQQRALAVIDTHLAQPHDDVSQLVPEALHRLHQSGRALQVLHTEQISDTGEPFALLWSLQGKPMRNAPGFAEFTRDFGFISVWDKYGAPDMCRRIAAGDYACD